MIEIKPFFSRCTFCSRPNQLPLLGVDLYAFQQIPKDITYRYGLLALGRVHPLE
jgi:hypothetical protein